MNLIHDGVNEVADTVLVKARARKTTCALWVAPNGCVRIEPTTKSWRREAPPPDAHLVGLYTGSATHKLVREDLMMRLREIRA